MPWSGGIPAGRVISEADNAYRFVVKQYRHRLHSRAYNPPFNKIFPTLEEATKAQADFNDQYKIWRNKYRVAYCELTDQFYLEVSVNHFFPEAVFMCDLTDIGAIFGEDWKLKHSA
jgi:hypothetical protein